MVRFNDIVEEISQYNPHADVELLEKAYVLSAKAHKGATRLSGEPYLTHPLEVAYTLTKMNLDVPSIVAGLLAFCMFSMTRRLPSLTSRGTANSSPLAISPTTQRRFCSSSVSLFLLCQPEDS